jgi:hypothetical protein
VEAILSQREMRARDSAPGADEQYRAQRIAAPDRSAPPFGVRVSDPGAAEPAEYHYPDLLLIVAAGRIAIELALSSPGGQHLDSVLTGYASDPNIAAALYLIDNPTVGDVVEATAERLGLSTIITVQHATIGYQHELDPVKTTGPARQGRAAQTKSERRLHRSQPGANTTVPSTYATPDRLPLDIRLKRSD